MKKPKPYFIAVTGNFGVGKSLVGKILKELNVAVVDTDELVRNILKTKNKTTKKIVGIFGEKILNGKNKSKYIDRKTLGKLVFNNSARRKKLELIIHPEVRKEIFKLKKNTNKKIIAMLIPLLFETKQQNDYDETWCVVCDRKNQYKRLIKKGFSIREINLRLKAQLPQNKKSKLASFVINNSGTIQETRSQIKTRISHITGSIKP
ncbi:MAG: dephospho-CoA kinase [Candidatus Melainabacteria bacterium]|nr:dephospho-CoA kinase [Candidatus Melainabacteria bacterium]